MNNYLNILEESLEQKIQILAKVQEYNEEQEKIFSAESVDLNKFDSYVDEKGKLIDAIQRLDQGFETLYQNVKIELENNKEQYAVQIKNIQLLIAQITEMSMSIQAKEARNKTLIEAYFSKERAGIKHERKASKAAYDYYKSMNKRNVIPPQFLDQKK